MNTVQEKLLSLVHERGVVPLNYSKIGKDLGGQHPQNVKYHLFQLERKGLIVLDRRKKLIKNTKSNENQKVSISTIKILGSANCGLPLAFAEESHEGNLKVSNSIVPQNQSFFAVRTKGNSLNNFSLNGKLIEDGDYLIIDSEVKSPNEGDLVLSVIDGAANIKKIAFDKENGYIILLSDSTEKYDPIIINENDEYHIGGVVKYLVKKPKVELI